MKTFLPGQIASAKDINDNFAEAKKAGTDAHAALNKLNSSLNPSAAKCIPVSGWELYGSLGTVITSGRIHMLPITIRRTKGNGFNVQAGTHFSCLNIPGGVAVPTVDWTNIGLMQIGAYSVPLLYRTNTRSVLIFPTASFTWPQETWAYGHASWIA